MATVQMKCPNCGGTMGLINNQFKCPNCRTMILNIVDAKIDADVTVMSPDEFARKIEESKRQFVINIDEHFEVFDIQTRVINKKISDAASLLQEEQFDMVPKTLLGVPETVLSAERLRYLAAFKVKNETDLLEHNGYVENVHYHNILELADPQTRATYVKLADFCRQKYDARAEAISKVQEGEQLLSVDLKEDALIYAQKMCREYPMYAITWLFLAHVVRSIDPHYDCEREWGIINLCFDFKYYGRSFPYGLNGVFEKKFGHGTTISGSMRDVYKKWFKILGKVWEGLGPVGFVGIPIALYLSLFWVGIAVVLSPILFLFYLPRFLRGNRSIEKASAVGKTIDLQGSMKLEELKKNKQSRKNRIVVSVVCIIAAAVIVPIVVVTTNNEWHNGFRYKQQNGTLSLADVNAKNLGVVVIPAEIRGMPVVTIEARAFEDCKELTSIIIPNSVTSIGIYAFQGCSGLASVKIPNSVTSIECGIFNGCTSLTSVTIPNSVTSIRSSAFKNCTSLANIIIPNNVTYLGEHVFSGCTSLTSITIPSSVKRIDEYAFLDCHKLSNAIFENTDGWKVYGSFSYENSADVSIPSANARNLRSVDVGRVWVRGN